MDKTLYVGLLIIFAGTNIKDIRSGMKNEISYDENKETQVWNIYQSLRGEVAYANAFNYKIISILVPAVTIILSLGYKLNNINSQIPIFLSAFFIAYSCSRLMQANRRRIWRITTYMVVFLEPHLTHVNWESDLQKQRRKAEKKGVTNAISSLVGSNEVITPIKQMERQTS